MTDRKDSPSEPPLESFQTDECDFSGVAITESEYTTYLDDIASVPFVNEVSHSLALNEIAVAIEPTFTGRISTDTFPEDVTIRLVTNWDSESDTDNRLCVEFRTTRLLCRKEEEHEYFPGEYDPEAIAALVVELNLFDEVATVDVSMTDADEAVADISLTTGHRSTYLFDDLLTFLGYTIRDVWVEDGMITRLRIGFDETQPWSREAYQEFQNAKYRGYKKAYIDASESVTLPCGHDTTPTIAPISDIYEEHVAGFPTVTVDGSACHKIAVEDATAAFLEVSEWPTGIDPVTTDNRSTGVAIERGFLCTECDLFYPFVDADAVGTATVPAGSTQPHRAIVRINGTHYPFAYLPIAARPVGHRDGYVSE